jgi:hypothetical protein
MLPADSDPDLQDFLARCFDWDPDKRMKIEEAFEHPFLTQSR